MSVSVSTDLISEDKLTRLNITSSTHLPAIIENTVLKNKSGYIERRKTSYKI